MILALLTQIVRATCRLYVMTPFMPGRFANDQTPDLITSFCLACNKMLKVRIRTPLHQFCPVPSREAREPDRATRPVYRGKEERARGGYSEARLDTGEFRSCISLKCLFEVFVPCQVDTCYKVGENNFS